MSYKVRALQEKDNLSRARALHCVTRRYPGGILHEKEG